MTANQESVVFTGVLFDLKLANGNRYRFQNFDASGAIAWEGKTYDYLPIGYAGAPRSLQLDNSSITAVLPNAALLRNFVRGNDGLRKASVTITRIFPDEPNTQPYLDRLQVQSSSFQYPKLEIKLRSPFSTIEGKIPSIYFDSKRFPELPTTTNVQLG